ncbi:MAG: dTMP kinase [Anaerolineae bacterium]|nr:dTMP kinase [Anaerolineae bacterium]
MGMFITLEGPDGSGKTTQAHLVFDWLRHQGQDVLLTREPGGSDIGDQVREVLHDSSNSAMAPQTEFLLYSASRAQHVSQLILPSLKAGKIVISDRYADSSLAYQGYGRGLDLEMLQLITAFATRGLKPDLTLYFDIPAGDGLQRRLLSGEAWNRMDAEALAFHRRVRTGYLELANAEPDRWKVIDASRSIRDVQRDVRSVVRARLERG